MGERYNFSNVGRGLAPAALNITYFCNGGSKPPPYDVSAKLTDKSKFETQQKRNNLAVVPLFFMLFR